MRASLLSPAVLLLAIASAAPARAQEPAPASLQPGDTVRIQAPTLPHRVRGELVRYHADTLSVREAGTGREYAVALADLRDVERSMGTDRGRSAWRTARLGGFVGLSAGLVAGVLLGAGLGALFAPEQWQRFRVQGRAGAAAGSGVALAVSLPVP